LQAITDFLNKKYGAGTVELDLLDQYRNMRRGCWNRSLHIVDTGKQAMRNGYHSHRPNHRGGTDGAQLSYMGLPTPNLFAGGHNFHGPLRIRGAGIHAECEWMCVLRIITLYAEK
jgi:tripeptide aminopeptidase